MLVLFYLIVAVAVGLLAWLSLRDPLMRRGVIRKPRRKRRGDYD